MGKLRKKRTKKRQSFHFPRFRSIPSYIVIFVLICGLVLTLWQVKKRQDLRSRAASITGLHVQGNQIVNSEGQAIRLLGVNRSGAEYQCFKANTFFDGPTDDKAIDAMVSWKINAVRLPMNEHCWLGGLGTPDGTSGQNYKNAIVDFVNRLNAKGIIVILDLQWVAPGSDETKNNPMPDADHAIDYWKDVATTFKDNSSVLFDVLNEPYPDGNKDTEAGWKCWRDGGSCPGVSYQTAGMQSIVDAIRSTGATQIIMLGGLKYSNALSQWLTYKPNDPLNNLVASWHVYNFNECKDTSCYDSQVLPVAQQVPVITGEMGENDCAHGFIDGVMNWADQHYISYLGWAWNTGSCTGWPSLINDYGGSPTNFGQGFKDHLAQLASNPIPAPSVAPGPSSPPVPSFVVVGDCTANNTCPSTSPGVSLGVPSSVPSDMPSEPMPSTTVPSTAPSLIAQNPSPGVSTAPLPSDVMPSEVMPSDTAEPPDDSDGGNPVTNFPPIKFLILFIMMIFKMLFGFFSFPFRHWPFGH